MNRVRALEGKERDRRALHAGVGGDGSASDSMATAIW